MTTNAPTVLVCPQCNETNGVPLTDGTRLCLNCRHEWNPTHVGNLVAVPDLPAEVTEAGDVAPEATTPATLAQDVPAEVADILGPPAEVIAQEAAEAALAAMVGTVVVLEGGQLATIVGFPDDDHAEVVLEADTDTGATTLVALDDVERSVAAPPPVADVPDETAAALARVNMAVAGLVIRAGLGALEGEYPHAQLVTPPTGWLPLDVEGLPAIEQGAAYAVAFLVHAYSLDRDIVGAIADTLIAGAQSEDEPTKGGTEQ